MYGFRRALILHRKYCAKYTLSKRNCNSSIVPLTELIEKRNVLFAQEQKNQLESVGRIEKITVEVSGPPEDVVLVMNGNISTPYDCCKHISQALCQQAALALVNDKILWDMHRPLPGDCSVKFLKFKDKEQFNLNKAFWRTGSFILGAVISRAFKPEVPVMLHSFPPPVVKSGSFVYDVIMPLPDWRPTVDELKVLSAEFLTLVQQNLKIERLRVKKSLAMEIFEGNPVKQSQIPSVAASDEDHLVTLYRVGDHIDISRGPMVGDTSFFGRCSVTGVYRVTADNFELYRFQGVALPKGIMLNNFAYGIIEARGARLNEADVPNVQDKRNNYYGTSNVVPTNSKIDVPKNFLSDPY